jgi:hypothetical protein
LGPSFVEQRELVVVANFPIRDYDEGWSERVVGVDR